MTVRGFAPRTHTSYLDAVVRLAQHCRQCPAQITDAEIQTYLAYLIRLAPLTGADIRTLMVRTPWARFRDATLKAPHAVQWLSDNGPQYTATPIGARARLRCP